MMAGVLPPAPNLGIGRHSGVGKVQAARPADTPDIAWQKIKNQIHDSVFSRTPLHSCPLCGILNVIEADTAGLSKASRKYAYRNSGHKLSVHLFVNG